VGALAYIGKTGNTVFGGAALFALGLGMGAPLILVGASLGKWLPKAGGWMDSIKILFGILLLGVAINLISRVIPGNITLFLWACLIILSAVFLGALSWPTKTSLGKLGQATGIILLLYGAALIVGSAMGNDNFMRPLAIAGNEKLQSNKIAFTRIKTLADLQQQLQLAKQLGKPVLLDFYADWCVACKEMGKTTFADPKVKKTLSNFVLLQADVTANDSHDKMLEQQFNVIAPPTFIFFDKNGQELPAIRIVGETGAERFLSIAREAR
jgi:thiol:disulfide interchange protein DsbD